MKMNTYTRGTIICTCESLKIKRTPMTLGRLLFAFQLLFDNLLLTFQDLESPQINIVVQRRYTAVNV